MLAQNGAVASQGGLLPRALFAQVQHVYAGTNIAVIDPLTLTIPRYYNPGTNITPLNSPKPKGNPKFYFTYSGLRSVKALDAFTGGIETINGPDPYVYGGECPAGFASEDGDFIVTGAYSDYSRINKHKLSDGSLLGYASVGGMFRSLNAKNRLSNMLYRGRSWESGGDGYQATYSGAIEPIMSSGEMIDTSMAINEVSVTLDDGTEIFFRPGSSTVFKNTVNSSPTFNPGAAYILSVGVDYSDQSKIYVLTIGQSNHAIICWVVNVADMSHTTSFTIWTRPDTDWTIGDYYYMPSTAYVYDGYIYFGVKKIRVGNEHHYQVYKVRIDGGMITYISVASYGSSGPGHFILIGTSDKM